MLRFLYIICDLFAGLLAIGSPVAIFHWLVNVTKIQGLLPFAAWLDPVFLPMNDTLNLLIQLPVLHYNGNDIPIAQGVVACLMTAGFFALNFCSETCKAMEQRLDVEKQAQTQRRRLQQIKTEQQHRQKQLTGNKKLYLTIQYDFKACPPAAAHFEESYLQYGGRLVESAPQSLTMEFENIERAFKYALTTSQGVLSHYASLRPIDPQPPYRIGIQAIDAALPGSEAVPHLKKLVSYTGQNQILFGPEVVGLLSEQGLLRQFHFQSVGLYMLDGQQAELFRLFYEKRE